MGEEKLLSSIISVLHLPFFTYFFLILYFFLISCSFFIHVSAIYKEQKYVNICVNYSNFSIITSNSLDAFSFAN